MVNRTAETEETFDRKRIRHLLKLGIFSACMVMLGDVLLGWGVSDPKVTEIPRMFTRFLSVSDARIYASAMLGLVFIPIECLCWFAVYRMTQPYSPKIAHAYRAGIIGCLAFGGCGVHVPCCAAAWLLKRFYTANPNAVYGELLRWVMWFLIPATVIFLVFFLIVMITQWKAFSGGYTPYPRWCRIFSILFGFVWLAVVNYHTQILK